MDLTRTTVWIFGVILVGIVQFSLCQFGPLRAKTLNEMQTASVGDSVVLTCSSETGVPLGICLWERKSPEVFVNGSDANLLITFNVLTSRPDLPSGTEGYSYAGEGLLKGTCGLKIIKVKEEDYRNWQCTLVGENKIYRESIKLQKPEAAVTMNPITKDSTNLTNVGTSSAVASNALDPKAEERQAKEFEISVGTGTVSEPKPIQREGRPRPVITAGSVGDAEFSRAFRPTSGAGATTGSQVEEIQIQSAGLVIVPRKSRKLVILE